MGKTFARSILRGSRKLSDVPASWVPATVEALEMLCSPELFAQIMEEGKTTGND